MRAIILGAGIAGLSTAIALRRVGIPAIVYERASELREVGAGISLWANAFAALDAFGAGDSVRAVSLEMDHFEIRAANGHRLLLARSAASLKQQFGMTEYIRMTHRADLVAALASHLPAESLCFGHECIAISDSGIRPRVKFANGHSDEADVLVGADGIRSVVRRAIQGEQPPRYSGYTCWRGVCGRPNTLPEGSMGEWWGRGQRFGITAIPGNKIYWFAVQNASPDQHEADEREYLLRHYADWATPCLALIESTPRESILRNDIIDRVPNRNWSRGGMGIVGDAAHPTTPNLGQGGCMAIEDAVVLARCLVQAPDAATAWKKFAQERWPRTSAIVNKSWQFGRIAQRQGRVSCWVRDRLVGLLLRWLGPSEPLKFVRFDIGSLPEPGASSSSST